MSNKDFIPNSFQTPNFYIDRAMEHVDHSELRVLLFVVRHTLGWYNHIHTRTAPISITMLVEGFTYTNEDGEKQRMGGCGIGRNAVSKALNRLEGFRFVERVGYTDEKGQEWRLGSNPDWESLEKRTIETDESNKERIFKANETRLDTHTVGRYGGVVVPSHEMTVAPSDDTGVVPSHGLNQTQVKDHENTYSMPNGGNTNQLEDHTLLSLFDDDMPLPPVKPTTSRKPDPWYDAIDRIWGYKKDINGSMKNMLLGKSTDKRWKMGNLSIDLTPEQLERWAAWYRKEKLGGNPNLNMLEDRAKIKNSIEGWFHTLIDMDKVNAERNAELAAIQKNKQLQIDYRRSIGLL